MNTWNIDQAHSVIGFKVKHLMVSTVRGAFTDFSGSINAEDNTFENASISFSLKTASITTHNEGRDGHLHSADFFDVAQFPTISFVSTSFMKKGDAYELVGNLTIKGVTKSVILSATSDGVGAGMDGKPVVGFDVVGTINREEFGLTWNPTLESRGFVVSDKVALDIHIEAVQA